MSQSKVVKRSVAIALGIICIILVAGLGVVLFMGYSPTSGSSGTYWQTKFNDLNATYNDYMNTHSHSDSDYNQLQAWLDGNKTLLGQTQTWLDGNITAYNNYINDHHHTDEDYTNINNIVNLANFTVVVDDKTVSQPAGGLGFANTNWTFSANYAGYVLVNILSADSTTYVELIYSSHSVNYDSQVNVGTSGPAYFPVLSSSNILVEVGNKNLVGGATETVTITYYY